MSGSSLDGIDIAFVEFHESGGKWQYTIKKTVCTDFPEVLRQRLQNATGLKALDYQLLHVDFGHYIGKSVNDFIRDNGLEYQVQLIASHGHTTFHVPDKRMTSQLGDGAAIAAGTGINVVSDLRVMDVALHGQGAPIVPIGEKLLLGNYDFFLNLGGIANISCNNPQQYMAFDICPANRVLNMLAKNAGKTFDDRGQMAAGGTIQNDLLKILNKLEYYEMPWPKSLANDFGTDVVYPLIKSSMAKTADGLRTFVEHVAIQIAKAIEAIDAKTGVQSRLANRQLLITGGGAHNTFLAERIKAHLDPLGVELIVPPVELIDFKEALVMALIGVLRWREEYNVLASVTGAERNTINGAVWLGNEA